MAVVTLTSPCKTNHLPDASFSLYSNNAEGTFVAKLAKPNPALNSLITTPNENIYLGRKKFDDGEIGVFGAEKYFNGGTDEEKTRIANKGAIKHQYEKDDLVNSGPVKSKIQPGTPSAYSESSCNNQSVLMHNVQRNPPLRKTNKVNSKSFLANLGCNCPCSDKNSVDVDENSSDKSVSFRVVPGKTIPKEAMKTCPDSRLNPWEKEEMPCKKFDELGLGLKREDRFSFPVLNPKAGNLVDEDNKPRKSLEVFGSPTLEKGKKTLSLERRLTMLSWDAKARAEETEIPASSEGVFNDTGSDASSDLFEIESFTTNGNSFLTRQASDGMSSCVTPTTCYAPSEASIEWSVVTASAADFSVLSDSEELRTATTTIPNKMILTAKTATKEETQKRRPSLLGCKSHKAVGVAGDAYITRDKTIPIPNPRGQHRSDYSFAPMTRFQAETKLTGFDSRNGRHVFDAQSVSQSHTAHSSHLLYIQ